MAASDAFKAAARATSYCCVSWSSYFEENEVGRWPQKTEDMQLQCQVKKWKDIPEQVHPDGMEAAKAARRIAKGKGGKSTKTDTATAKPEAESSSAPISLEPESSSAPIKIEEEESASAGKKRPLEEETAGETNKKVKVGLAQCRCAACCGGCCCCGLVG